MKLSAETGLLEPLRAVQEVREVYFIHAEKLDLIKIGVADNAKVRLRGLSNSCPDRLRVLGVLICRNFGKTEADIHKLFERERHRGEWFIPTQRLRDYITVNAWNPKRAAALQAYLDLPNMPRGRPKKNAAGSESVKPVKNDPHRANISIRNTVVNTNTDAGRGGRI